MYDFEIRYTVLKFIKIKSRGRVKILGANLFFAILYLLLNIKISSIFYVVKFEGWELESSDLGKRVILYKKTVVINNLKKLNKYDKI